MWVIRYKPIQVVGTDPTAANNFVNNTVDLTRTGITFDEVKQLLKAEYETQKARDAVLHSRSAVTNSSRPRVPASMPPRSANTTRDR